MFVKIEQSTTKLHLYKWYYIMDKSGKTCQMSKISSINDIILQYINGIILIINAYANF